MGQMTDKDRLDWLEKDANRGRHILPVKSMWWVRKEAFSTSLELTTILGKFKSIRKAIDCAMTKIKDV